MNQKEMQNAIDQYIKDKPKIIISHDCPNIVRKYFFNISDKSLTTNGMQFMFDSYKPDLWIFGHHHKSKNEVIEGTKFVCLSELEWVII